MTLPAVEESGHNGEVNPIRLKVFLEEMRENGYDVDRAVKSLSAEQAVVLQHANEGWIPFQNEISVIRAICNYLSSWALLAKVGNECLYSALLSLMPELPRKISLQEMVYRLPSAIALFATHLQVRFKVSEQGNTFYAAFSSVDGNISDVDVLFLTGLVRGYFQFFSLVPQKLEILNCPPLPESASFNFPKHEDFAENHDLFRIGLTFATDKREIIAGKKEALDTYDSFVQAVMRRSSELLQAKRELLTAVEYLNMANLELEKEINANKKELKMARNIQKGFVPARIPDWKGLQFWIKFYPLQEVSGDFYDFFPMGSEKLGLLVADVSGHGVPAALISAIAKLSFNNHRLDSPAQVFSNVNLDMLRYVKREGYLTAFYMIIDSQYNITYSVAAAPRPMLLRARTGEIEILPGSGTLLGMFPDAGESYLDQRTHLEPGDKIFIFTDGLTEAQDVNGGDLDENILADFIKETLTMGVQESSEHVMDRYNEFMLGSSSKDDLTVITLMLSKDADNFDNLVREAISAQNNGELNKACEILLQAIKIFPRHPSTLFLLGRFLTRNKQYEDAIEYLNQYNVLKPYNADAYTILAVCEFRIGNIEKAYDELKRSLSLRNDNPSALYNLVKVQLALGQTNEAQSSFAALEFLRPNHPRVQTLKKKMEQI